MRVRPPEKQTQLHVIWRAKVAHFALWCIEFDQLGLIASVYPKKHKAPSTYLRSHSFGCKKYQVFFFPLPLSTFEHAACVIFRKHCVKRRTRHTLASHSTAIKDGVLRFAAVRIMANPLAAAAIERPDH
jgi:hypothetical protein